MRNILFLFDAELNFVLCVYFFFFFFNFRINVIEKKLEDVMYETRGWEEKNKRHLDRVSGYAS